VVSSGAGLEVIGSSECAAAFIALGTREGRACRIPVLTQMISSPSAASPCIVCSCSGTGAAFLPPAPAPCTGSRWQQGIRTMTKCEQSRYLFTAHNDNGATAILMALPFEARYLEHDRYSLVGFAPRSENICGPRNPLFSLPAFLSIHTR
jgi:hypothetical protein